MKLTKISLCLMLFLVACSSGQTISPTREPKLATAVPTEMPAFTPTPPPTIANTTTPTPSEPTFDPLATQPPPTALPPTPLPARVCLPHTATEVPAFSGDLRFRGERDGSTYVWHRATGELEEVGLGSVLIDGEGNAGISPNQTHLAYAQPIPDNDTDYELWLADPNGDNPRAITTVSGAEILTRNEWATHAKLQMQWLGDSGLVLYHFEPWNGGLGRPPYETLFVWDVNAANEASTTTRQLLPASDVQAIQYLPDQQTLATLADNTLRLVDIPTGNVQQIAVPVPDALFTFIDITPDNSHLYFPTPNGVGFLNLITLSVQVVKMPFPGVGLGHYVAYPRTHWSPDGTHLYVMSPNNPTGNFSDPVPDTTLTIWEVTLADYSATPLHTFPGYMFSVEFSPDGQHIAWWTQSSNRRQLWLANILTGETTLYDSGNLLEFAGWSPDNVHFLYHHPSQPRTLQLGGLCSAPQEFTEFRLSSGNYVTQWVDADRFTLSYCSQSQQCDTLLVPLDGDPMSITPSKQMLYLQSIK